MSSIFTKIKKTCCHKMRKHDRSGGIKIRANGRDTFLYEDHEHRMTIYAELLMGTPERRVFMESIKHWAKPFNTDPITEEKRKEILSALCQYFDRCRITYEVVEDDE